MAAERHHRAQSERNPKIEHEQLEITDSSLITIDESEVMRCESEFAGESGPESEASPKWCCERMRCVGIKTNKKKRSPPNLL